jgi:hypothetical protein
MVQKVRYLYNAKPSQVVLPDMNEVMFPDTDLGSA